jgi:hypothetical protein
MTAAIDKLPAEIQKLLPVIIKSIPLILKRGFGSGVLIAVIKVSPEYKKVMENPEYKEIALHEISCCFGDEKKDQLVKIFNL